jgi:beta-lactamase class A
MTEATLRDTILRIGEDARASAVAVAVYDFEHHTTWSINPARWFHAASTIKVPVLLGVYDAIEQHRFDPISRVHVRNRFISVVDGRPYRVPRSSDANAEVQAAIGRMLTVHELAEHMIVTSSNLATNLLLDLVGIEAARASLARLHVSGIDLRRGVEDEPSRPTPRRRCSTSCTSSAFAAASRPASRRMRASPTRPARSPPSPTTQASSISTAAMRTSW